ncbi:MFS transporter [Ectobacillus ponti]|uniref:MFS transporter n=1 Tax=Ectobacillus ponti TaxID=2961894 RepID=A0AA41XCM9_9BACI|nr:MFS transporter [Ectobacillus ponti]MCP8969631.1 MFS transporter [Ectobacillus ponti]
MHASRVYIAMRAVMQLANAIMFTTYALYYVTGLGLNPLQLVLIGTFLELTVLLFEIPTGVFADTRGRRFSVITGTIIIGIAYVLEGTVPYTFGLLSLFAGVVIAEIIRGVGETFLSGAASAWLTDEVGESHVGSIFLRASRIDQAANVIGILLSVGLSSIILNLPYIVGGALYLLLALFLILKMKETQFQQVDRSAKDDWKEAGATFKSGASFVRRSPILMALLLGTLFAGAGSEGFDRLWEANFLMALHFPDWFDLTPAVWFGLISIAGSVLSYFAAALAEKRLDLDKVQHTVGMLMSLTLLRVLLIAMFALANSFPIGLISILLLTMVSTVAGPLYDTWLNQNIPSQSRATILSLMSQGNALGQSLGGPVVGAVGTRYTIRASLFLAGLLYLPVVWVYAKARKHI